MQFVLECFGFLCDTICTNRTSHHQTGIDETLAKNMCKVVTKLIIAHHSNNKAVVITMTKK